jgi:hypothetical protein
MLRVPRGTPFAERGGRLRGALDLAAGHYPGFLFGLAVGRLLPVFHFHEETAASLEPAFEYLVENGYRTVGADDLGRLVRDGRHPGPRTVMLAFDDAWASLWLVVAPLLDKYDLTAVSYAIPWRLREAGTLRPRDGSQADPVLADRGPNPFITWQELRALSSSGRVDVQSHTWTHSMIFAGDRPLGIVDETFAGEDPLSRPRIERSGAPTFLGPDRRGAPLFARRSRMSEARRFFPDPDAWRAVEEHSRGLTSPFPGRWESDGERRAAIEAELVNARDELSARLRTCVRHVCLPWGVTSSAAREALERLGFRTAFANRIRGRLAVAAGDDPFFLKRLHSRHIFALPGRGRRVLVTLG